MADVKVNIIAEDNFTSTLGNFGNIMTGIKSVIDMVGDAFRFFKDYALEGLDAIASYERLTATLETLTAKELLATGEFKNMTDALSAAGPKAEELLNWMQELAIKSPFTMEGVANAFRTAQAYGFTADEAQRLTQAMIDFAAGSGASEVVMSQIALALGQIQAKGKLAGQEVLQLVNAGLPVTQILADAFGVTTAEIVKMQEQGLIPAHEAIEAITVYLETNFAGAAERQANTWAGLQGTFEDIKQMGLREFFGGLFDAIQPVAVELSNWLQGPGLEKLNEWGDELGRLVEPLALIAQVFFMRMDAGADPITALIETLKGTNFTEFQGFIDSILAFIETGQNEGWGVAIGNLIDNLIASMDLPGKISVVVDWILTNLEGKQDQIGAVLGAVFEGALTIALTGIAIATDVFMPLANTIVQSLVIAFRNVNIGEEIWRAVVGDVYVDQSGQDIASHIGRMIIDAWNNFWKGSQVVELGKSIIEGIELGLNIMSLGLYGRVQSLAQSVIDLFKRIFGIASPSTVFKEIGMNLILGLIDGINSMFSTLLTFIGIVVTKLLEPFKPILDLLGIDIGGGGLSAEGLGTAGGGVAGTSTLTSANNYYNYYYGPVYFQGTGQTNGGVDCQSPNPALSALGSSLPAMGVI